jgi:hypothetical protein
MSPALQLRERQDALNFEPSSYADRDVGRSLLPSLRFAPPDSTETMI